MILFIFFFIQDSVDKTTGIVQKRESYLRLEHLVNEHMVLVQEERVRQIVGSNGAHGLSTVAHHRIP